MESLDEEIAALKAEIEGYKLELKDATTLQEKSGLRGLIKSSRDILTRLLDEKKAQSLTRFKLGDGLPELVQNLTLSPPSVPPEIEHASCERIVMDFPFRTAKDVIISSATNTIWMEAHQVDDRNVLVYSSEDDIVHFVRDFMRDIIFALELPLRFNAEVTIKQIRPDLCVLIMNKYLVGVVKVKKPGGNVLLQPTVLGELLDQMLLVEGFYGMGPLIGILATAEEWLLAWFPVDTASLENCDITITSKDSYSTPSKLISSVEASGSMRDSPPGDTPSQKSGTLHCIENVPEDIPEGSGDDNNDIEQPMERVLCTTEVVNIHTDRSRVLQFLCSAFQLMAMSRTHHRAGLSRCLLKFHKGISAVTFHPAAYDDILPMVNFDKYPAKNVKNLVALEDLGRGSTGKAWLCVTVTRPRSAACVLKFDNKEAKSERLVHERDMWSLLYPEVSSLISLEQWSGAEALVMPHFSTVSERERGRYKDELLDVLTTKFMGRGKVHRDVRWCNIGKYRSSSGSVVLVVFDLHDVVDYNVDAHGDWIGAAMKSLFDE